MQNYAVQINKQGDHMEANVITMPVGNFATNCYLVYDDNNVGVIVDPGGEAKKILEAVEAYKLDIKAILLTHGHCDHLAAAAEVQEALKLPLYIHPDDVEELKRCREEALEFGLEEPKGAPNVTDSFQEGQILKFGALEFRVLHTPGHTPGGVTLVCGAKAFCGDTIFRASVGRTDFPGGDQRRLFTSIQNKIYALAEDTILFTGHDAKTSVGYEKRNNPFVRGK